LEIIWTIGRRHLLFVPILETWQDGVTMWWISISQGSMKPSMAIIEL